MSDLLHQDINPTGSDQSKKPQTIASAATVAPTTFLTILTGTTAVANITPPTTGHHMLAIVHNNASPATYLTSGNVLNAVVPTQNVPCLFIYDPIQAKYYGMANNVT